MDSNRQAATDLAEKKEIKVLEGTQGFVYETHRERVLNAKTLRANLERTLSVGTLSDHLERFNCDSTLPLRPNIF